MPKYNPFKPGSIVTPGMFAGRLDEVIALEKSLFQTKHDNGQHFWLSGERGIGKSSLLYFLQMVGTGEVESVSCGKFNFLALNIELEPTNTYLDIISKVGSEYKRVLREETHIKAFLVRAHAACWSWGLIR